MFAFFIYRWLSKRINNKNTGAYSFQNAFFYLQFANDESIYDQKVPNAQVRATLVTQKKTRRFAKQTKKIKINVLNNSFF